VSRRARALLRRVRSDGLLSVSNGLVARIPSHLLRNAFLRRAMRVQLGPGSSVHMGLRLYTRGGVSIGRGSVIDRDCVLDGRGTIRIGDGVNLAPEVMVLTASHDADDLDGFGGVTSGVVIDDHAWIATRALLLPGIRIGRGAVVGAGSVVTRDVADGVIVAGNPARPIGERSGIPRHRLEYRRLFH
jgi:acetyltransferase-like isoleucine patch superfamily enzyme